MAIIQLFKEFFKKTLYQTSSLRFNKPKINKVNVVVLLSVSFFITVVFFTISSSINKKNIVNKNNFSEVTKSNEFSNLTTFLISKINSPYKEIKYTIKNNDSIERILKKYDIDNNDIKNISLKLKQKKLSNIYSGRELSLILKKLSDGRNTIINLV